MARTTSDYSKALTRIRDAVAALPVHSAVLDDEAIVMRSADRCDFEALRSRQGQAEAILVAYDIMEADGQDVRPEPLEERRKRRRSSCGPGGEARQFSKKDVRSAWLPTVAHPIRDICIPSGGCRCSHGASGRAQTVKMYFGLVERKLPK